MVASLAACALFLAPSDVMVGVVVTDDEGQLTTFAATISGASRRMTTRVGIAWIKTPTGWTWVANRRGKWGSGTPGKLFKELTPPASTSPQRRWTPAWIEPESMTWGLVSRGPSRALSDLRREPLGPALPPPPEASEGLLKQSFLGLSAEEQDRWSPFTLAAGSGGYVLREGVLHWGASLASSRAGVDDFLVLSAPLSARPSLLWISAKAVSGTALSVVGSGSTGWGFIVTPDEVKLAPIAAERFGAPQRVQSHLSASIVGWWVAEGDIQEVDAEFRSLRLPQGW